ncbi:male-specific lethal 1-like 1 [Trichomycterus rosablanca]|uniref:male-specific lethal 1-like 1 n=1 Tax=Trichomycterus rosablanca TaxID=2290929 RepID=UPI002F35819C
MTMRTAAITNGRIKLDTDIRDQSKREILTSVKRDNSDFCVRVPSILSNIHNSPGKHFHNKAKTCSSSRNIVERSGFSPALRKGQEENWVTLGALTVPLAKQMGAEGSPVKSKSLFGHTCHNNLGKMDPVASNGSKQPRNAGLGTGTSMAGVSLPEHGLDGSVVKGTGHAASQTSCIRQILLLQLELIEQQQQQLDNKNKEIDDLKAEKEMLVARIERMERRLQTIKKGDAEVRPTPRRKNSVEPVSSESTGQSEEQSQTPQQTHFGRGGKNLKRRFLFQDSPVVKSRRGAPKTSPPKENQAVKEEFQEKREPEVRSHSFSVVESEELPYMGTTEMYLCCWHQPPSSPWQTPSPVEQDVVTVPSWRESSVEPLKDKKPTDILECLDDAVFMKRHSKLELDEKRRKRWDIQRIREQRMFQRLQQRMYKRNLIQESERELLSFYPEAEDVESIMITPFLPVVAFGRPLPNLKQQNFEVPWLEERSQSRREVSKKKTPHRTCRK